MKKQSIQKKFRNTTFGFHQYWNLHYTEYDSGGLEKDYAVFIKAKSYKLAKSILSQKITEDMAGVKIKSIQGAMFHKDYKYEGLRLNLEQWNQIREAAFPNIANVLYKNHLPRPKGKWNRFSYPRDLSHMGFKKGKENWSTINRKGKTLAPELREGKIWRGDKWVVWDKEDMLKTKNLIVNAFILHDNNRSKSAEYLGLSRGVLYKTMKMIQNTDWKKEYPPPKPFSNARPACKKLRSKIQKRIMAERKANGIGAFAHITKEQEAKRLKKLIATKHAQLQKSISKNIPLIKDALKNSNNIRRDAAKFLNVKNSWLQKWMIKTKHIIDWSKDYPSPYCCRK